MADHPTDPTVTIYTQAYNTKPYLEQCIGSVLSQTYTDFEYILIDNGCTDGSSALLDAFAEKDPRIRLIRYRDNQAPRPLRFEIVREYARGAYYTTIDSDDWWEPDYLERLVGFLEEHDLDMAITGTVSYLEQTRSSRILRKLDLPVILTREQVAQYYPRIWAFPSTFWGSVIKTDLFQAMEYADIVAKKYPYGTDTMFMLRYIESCGRIGIDNSALYHYRMRANSVSYQYSPRRFNGNVALYEQVKEFLEYHQTFDGEKREWLNQVHLFSMNATLEQLRNARISLEEKLAECAQIMKHPLTETVLTSDCEARTRWFALMWDILFMGLVDTYRSDQEKLVEMLYILSPDCGKAVLPEDLGLFAREPALWEALKDGDRMQLASLLLKLIAEKRYIKQYDLGAILHRLLPEGSLLQGIEDTRFFREYAGDCAELLSGNHMTALDHMTGLLLNGKRLYAPEQFLDLYLSLAALDDQASAFVFGKLRLAKLYLMLYK